MKRWGAALLAVCACGEMDTTAVRLVLRWDGEIDRIAIEGRIDGGASPYRMGEVDVAGGSGPREESLLILLPPDLDEERLLISARGSLAGTTIMEGRTEVSVARGRTVDAAIELEAIDVPEWFVRAEIESVSTSSVPFSEAIAIDFTPRSAGEQWLILGSGLLESDSMRDDAAEMRLMIDSSERDRFGAIAGGASGFFTFDLIEGTSEPVHASLEFRAMEGTTIATRVRLLAVRLPEGAAAQLARVSARLPSGAEADPILSLNLDGADPGRYLLAAGTSMRNGGSGTIEAWLRDPDGKRSPNAPEGVMFSSSADARQSFVTIGERNLAALPAEFTLEGRSNGRGLVTGWWNDRFQRRVRLRVKTTELLPGGYSISLPIEAFAPIRPDGEDLRIVFEAETGPIEIDRVLEPGHTFTSSGAHIWFATQEIIPEGGSDDRYVAYYDAIDLEEIEPAHDDARAVFELFDDFEGTSFDTGIWMLGGNATPRAMDGEGTLPGGAAIFSRSRFGYGVRFEARLRLSVSTADFFTYLSASSHFDPMHDHLTFFANQEEHLVMISVNNVRETVPYIPADPTEWHVYGITRFENRVRWDEDGRQVYSETSTIPGKLPATNLAIFCRNTAMGQQMIYDWIRVRKIRDPEPTVELLGMEEPIGLTGEWRHPRVLALPLDAFERAMVEEARDAQTVEGGARSLQRTTIGGAGGPRHYLVIQSLRVSGDPDAAARRSGEVRVGGRVAIGSALKTSRGRGADGGHHHVVAFADVIDASVPIELENAIVSPDGIVVEGADSVIVALGRSE